MRTKPLTNRRWGVGSGRLRSACSSSRSAASRWPNLNQDACRLHRRGIPVGLQAGGNLALEDPFTNQPAVTKLNAQIAEIGSLTANAPGDFRENAPLAAASGSFYP